jgi:hypothetical protein
MDLAPPALMGAAIEVLLKQQNSFLSQFGIQNVISNPGKKLSLGISRLPPMKMGQSSNKISLLEQPATAFAQHLL